MSTTSLESAGNNHDPWAEMSRDGEARVNWIRLAAILFFYAHHLLNVYCFSDDPSVGGRFHLASTALAASWLLMVFAVYRLLLLPRKLPGLKYATTAADLALLTLLLAQAGGVRSPLLVLYFLVIAAAALRWSLSVVYLAATGAILSYLFLLGAYAWYQIGWEEYYRNPDVRIPRSNQVIFVLGLGTAGFLAGQMVRQARRLVCSDPAHGEG